MANPRIQVDGGVKRRGGKLAKGGGGLLRASNSRYLPGDDDTLFGLLGRAAFNANPLPVASVQPPDHAVVKRIFAIFHDDGTMKLVVHQGGALYESDLDGAGEFTEAAIVAKDTLDSTPAGSVVSYQQQGYGDTWLYMIGATGRGSYSAWARTADGIWHRAGHYPPVEAFTITAGAGGDPFSSTEVRYTARFYDVTSDTESRHGPVQVLPAGTVGSPTLTWPVGVTPELGNSQEKGGHMRIYRTMRDEEPGVYWRIDGDDEGIDLSTVSPGFTFVDNVANEDAQDNGRVRADGIEGEVAWAEHGGEVPAGTGVTTFQNHTLVWGVEGFLDRVFYSAQGYPESFPVNFDGEYEYYIPFQTKKRDKVLKVVPMGPSMAIVAGETAIFRLRHLPTYTDPGFNRSVLELVTDEHGICGSQAIAPFGLNDEQAQGVIYVSREFGLILTDGLGATQLVPELDIHTLIDPAYWSTVEVIDYPKYQEVWVFYTPTGGTFNSEGVCIDYSRLQQDRGWFRVTWPIEVRHVSACFAFGADGVGRLYIINPSGMVFVQDSGTTDDQKIVNASGHQRFHWHTERYSLGGQGVPVHILRGFAYGRSGSERTFTVRHYALDGSEEWESSDKLTLGGTVSEGSDTFWCNQASQAFRLEIEFTGLTGSSYEDGANQAPGLTEIELEPVGSAKQGRTRTA